MGYLGPSIPLDRLVLKPEHSMLVQSYKPKELNNAILNGDGFGLGWHSASTDKEGAFVYRHTLPMWNDRSLDDLCRFVRSENFVVNLRSATDKMPVDLSNCQPFKWKWKGKQLLFVHNGLIENFFDSLYRPMRELLCDNAYKCIKGLTDSEHIFALLVHQLETQPGLDVAEALHQTVRQVNDMANKAGVRVAMNIIVSVQEESDASTTELATESSAEIHNRLIAFRYDNQQEAPSFYWLKPFEQFSDAIIFSSEPLFEGDWQSCQQGEILTVDRTLQMKSYAKLS